MLKKLVSIFIRLVHSANNELIFVTLFVEKLLENIILSKEKHPSNILLISITFLVLKLVKSKLVKNWESLNNPDMFTTSSVLKLDKFNESNFIPANRYEISFTLLKDDIASFISFIFVFLKIFLTETIEESSHPLILNLISLSQSSKALSKDLIFIFFLEFISIIFSSFTPLNILFIFISSKMINLTF